MAPIAGVGHPELLGQQRVRNCKSVVMARVALHINGLRHVAACAFIAFAGGRMVTVLCRIDDRRLGISARMALQAKLVAVQPGHVQRARMTIQTGQSRLMHLATQKSGKLVILVMNLTVGIKQLGGVHRGKLEVIVKIVAGFEIARQIRAPGVARGTHIKELLA